MTDNPLFPPATPKIICQWCGHDDCPPIPSVCPTCGASLGLYLDGTTTLAQVRDRLKEGGEGSMFAMELGPDGKVSMMFLSAKQLAESKAAMRAAGMDV